MQFIIFLLMFSTGIFAKTDFCKFSSEFSEKYMLARKNFAERIKEIRKDPRSKVNTGSARAREFKANWPVASMKQTVNKLFKTSDIDIKVSTSGKLLIYPKRVKEGEPMIIFDTAGDYFRIAKAHIVAGVVKPKDSFFDLSGKPIPFPPKHDKRANDLFGRLTHFAATP